MWCSYSNRVNAVLPIRCRDTLRSVILFCCSCRGSADHQCGHQGIVSDFQQFTAILCWDDLTWPLLTGAVWTAARLKTTVQRMGLCMTDRLQIPHKGTKKPGKQTYVHEHAHTHTQRILEPAKPPGQTGRWHRFWAITAWDTDSSKGTQTNTPKGGQHKQPRLLLFILSLFCF